MTDEATRAGGDGKVIAFVAPSLLQSACVSAAGLTARQSDQGRARLSGDQPHGRGCLDGETVSEANHTPPSLRWKTRFPCSPTAWVAALAATRAVPLERSILTKKKTASRRIFLGSTLGTARGYFRMFGALEGRGTSACPGARLSCIMLDKIHLTS